MSAGTQQPTWLSSDLDYMLKKQNCTHKHTSRHFIHIQHLQWT